jgi:hypothetical protein
VKSKYKQSWINYLERMDNTRLPKYALKYEGHLESKERFAIQRYLLIIGKKKYMQVL